MTRKHAVCKKISHIGSILLELFIIHAKRAFDNKYYLLTYLLWESDMEIRRKLWKYAG